ncbi:MAG: kelch repeat-containing protein [Candidatus Bathyarchaeota archaeon]
MHGALLLCIILQTSAQLPSTLATDSNPSERYGAAMAYDEANGRLILFGGSEWDDTPTFYDDTWAYNYSSNEWVELSPAVRPPPRFNPGVAYIPDRQAILIFGGYKPPERNLGDTWLFDVKTDTWRELEPSNSPTPRSNVGMAYDTKNGKVILFGGSSNSEYPTSDTWAYDFEANTWTEMHPAAFPKPQYGVGMVYDSLNERILLLEGHWVTRESGAVRDGYDGGLYTYDYAADTWTKIECSTPPGRYWYSTAYDNDLGRMIVFGGIRWIGGYGNMYDETWVYDSETNTWSKSIEKGPEKRYISGMAYDQGGGVTVLFGGAVVVGDAPGGGDLREYYSDTWALNATLGWSRLLESAAPVEPAEAEEPEADMGIPAFPVASLSIGLGVALLYLKWKRLSKAAWDVSPGGDSQHI